MDRGDPQPDGLEQWLAEVSDLLHGQIRAPGWPPPRGDPAALNRLRVQLIQARILRGRVVEQPGGPIALPDPGPLLPRMGMLLLLALEDPAFPDRVRALAPVIPECPEADLLVRAATLYEMERLAALPVRPAKPGSTGDLPGGPIRALLRSSADPPETQVPG